jgi:predicted transposase YbfD/YdcC
MWLSIPNYSEEVKMNYSRLADTLGLDEDGVAFDVSSLYARFQTIPDKRKRRGLRYTLAVILVALVLAKLAGQDEPKGIADWVRHRKELFISVFALKHLSMPHAATYRRVVGQADLVTALERVMREFLLSAPGAGLSQHLTLDGKQLRRVVKPEADRGMMLLAVYLPAEGLVLSQVAVDHKSNEIPAAPLALKQVNLCGKIVTADALHTQRALSEVVVAGGGHYVWTVKDNQPNLRQDIAHLFQPETCLPGTSPVMTDVHRTTTTTKAHGRLETRRLTTSTALAQTTDWPHLAQAFKVERTVHHLKTGVRHTEIVYGITSLTLAQAGPARLLALLRAHWRIENQLHWRRDVLLHEDQLRTQSATLGQAFACLNNFVIGLACRLGHTNLAQARRYFDAHPERALLMLLQPLP